MSHAPWTKEQAELWARQHMLSKRGEDGGVSIFAISELHGFYAGLEKAAEMIEACPTVYGVKLDGVVARATGSEYYGFLDRKLSRAKMTETHQAKLVGVMPIEKGES